MKRGILLLFTCLIILSSMAIVHADGTWSVDLVAGQHTTIGTVQFNITGDTLTATFQISSPGWCMTTTHFYAANVPPDRSAPGQFQYKHEGLDCVVTDVFTVPTPQGDVYVAAHADSHFDPNNLDNLSPTDTLTGTTSLVVEPGTDSYLVAQVDGAITGTYNAWCVDLSHVIYTGAQYTANVYDSYQAPTDIVDIYANLDLINYIINQDYSSFAKPYDIQVAIWLLIDNTTPYGITDAALAIVDDAKLNGEGFVPGCGQILGVIVEPIENNAQHLILEYPAPCPQAPTDDTARSETAWGLADWGTAFRTGWGMYFQLVDVPDDANPTETPTVEPPPTDVPPPTAEPPSNDHGNRARNDEAPGQNKSNDAPGNRNDEAPGQQNNNHAHNGNGSKNGN